MKNKHIIVYTLLFAFLSCNYFYLKKEFINDIIYTSDYNKFFEKNKDETYLFIQKRKISDYNQYFDEIFDDFRTGYYLLHEFKNYSKNNNEKKTEIVIASKNKLRYIHFLFKLDKNNKWILYDIYSEFIE